ncbi:hypothetical protein FHS82_000258 [Pseudochelatococcus lubricantis]|uniref:Uncharacterized protein n=1 Tax=Pseudochelatococcus lubricantis TaxID=1538102 RepID=A0ABX0UX66_9HYPH|nr:hypothetical protein [Pseudochelatococcus lubricantis]NIJ56445.1 hypothetical protein [Pseudochelatococcus lubricantis]
MTRVDLKKAGLVIGTVCAGLAFGMAAGSSEALAQERDTTGVFMKDVLGKLGIIEGDAPTIDYQERAPLVLPPSAGNNLPPPRAAGGGHPNWPTDPDVAARRRAIEAANKPVPVNRDNEEARPLRPDELRAGRRVGGGGVPAPTADDCHGDACSARPLDPRQLRGTASQKEKEPAVAYGKEPARATLTEPPKGYRMPSDKARIPEPEVTPVDRLDPASPYFFLNSQNRN